MYDQDFEKEYQEFNSAVALFAYIFKFRDKALVETCEHTLISILGLKYTTNIMNAAMFQLAESAPETCLWIWQNFTYLEACISLNEYLTALAIQKLISQGFVLGQDFSATADGKILINEKAKSALFQSLSHKDLILIEENIQVNEQVVFY
ncbi:hypothetical protein [Mastigocladopsis repens]|uniref:hypothetical protein n=1 Tax=Mastigocladopsis repens TaxID=221287 RepID=UPI0002FCEA39|nr:hypothetical protein [Mastigocladopsis repens]